MLRKLFFILFVFSIIPLIVLGCAEPAPPPSQPPSSGPSTPAPAPAPELIKLKAIQFLPMNNPGSKPFQTLVGRINEAAEGQLNIEIAGGPETIAQQEQAEAIRSGAVDVAMTEASSVNNTMLIKASNLLVLFWLVVREHRLYTVMSRCLRNSMTCNRTGEKQ